jgi:hypothetical protein
MHSFLQANPHLQRLALSADTSRDYLLRESSLPISEKDGVYRLCSSPLPSSSSSSSPVVGGSPGRRKSKEPYYCFAYEVKGRKDSEGNGIKGERVRFSFSPPHSLVLLLTHIPSTAPRPPRLHLFTSLPSPFSRSTGALFSPLSFALFLLFPVDFSLTPSSFAFRRSASKS